MLFTIECRLYTVLVRGQSRTVAATEEKRMTSAFELLWRDEEPARRGRRPSLSVREVVAAAVGIADANGLEAVSLQRVAAEFGFTTTSLYRYVPDKATLL